MAVQKLVLLAVVAACIFAITGAQNATQQCLNLDASPVLERFVDHVPVMRRINLTRTSSSRPLIIRAFKVQRKLHRDLPPTTVYAFGRTSAQASVPGPTLVAFKNKRAFVRWSNNITDANHLLAVDPTLDRAQPRVGVPLVVHLHGGETAPPYDGHPDAWITNGGERGPNFTTNVFRYDNAQPSTLLWYHDHSFGYTRLSVAAGLAGLYHIIGNDDPSWLPGSLRENSDGSQNPFIHDLVLQDRQFFPNGSINYPTLGWSFTVSVHPNWCPDYFGDTMLVNGMIWPYLNVSRGVHRFRFLNAGNSRFFILNLDHPSLAFFKIGSDGGLLTTPVRQPTLNLGPSERADVLIDFSSLRVGENVTIRNTATSGFEAGNGNNQSVFMFRVTSFPPSNAMLPSNTIDPAMANLTVAETILATTGFNISAANVTGVRRRQFVISFNPTVGTIFSDANRTFRSPVTEIVPLYTNEIWEFVNTFTNGDHPIHIHLINFFALDQQNYDVANFIRGACSVNTPFLDPTSCFTGNPLPPDVDHFGWKDTALVRANLVTRFFVPFRPREATRFAFDPTISPGYVWHCHLLEHEDNEMMRPLLFTN
ncbi:uncharacterized protein LOC112347080 [Selaginella moellendorffii]|uniref:uncharacterized protein LOC112347080 n=1 Tax=Selaginella moellendorffii TaxID=88036 RepID=UPI000D1D080C|nr:uncharacterized protein LOC112347080 [Selaginella moellendorffii]|eukprot:XP_024533136.1 uncharacterized protein LOC112347080 [Selaginella moellendorffii]